METGDPDVDTASKPHPPPFIVSLSPFTPINSPSTRRLSSCFTEPNRPAVRAARQLAWVSLQGRLIGAEEASSARNLSRENGLALGPNEAVAWELFSPVHRILIVAVIAVAAANSKSNQLILKLKKDVELRDQVLLHMQQKLDNLCDQVNCFKDQPLEAVTENYGCQLCQLHNVAGNSVYKISNCDEMSTKHKWNGADQEERRMSDLSDWNSSVTSSSEIQLNSLAIEQDIYNLKKESEDKDATIKELSAFIQSSEAFGSKRIAELEDVIHRKNMMITKLKEDLLVLEQKVVGLTRIRRSSLSGTQKNEHKGPLMVDNLVYDMDSSTGPSSSSDSDSSSPVKHSEAAIALTQDKDNKSSSCCSDKEEQSVNPKTTCVSMLKSRANAVTSSPPLKEKILNQEVNVASSTTPRLLKLNSFANENCKSRRRPPTQSRSKRWV